MLWALSMQEKVGFVNPFRQPEEPQYIEPEIAQPTFAQPDPALFPPGAIYLPFDQVAGFFGADEGDSDISLCFDSQGQPIVRTRQDVVVSTVSLKEIVARQDCVATLLEEISEDGFLVWQGRIPMWVLQDGLGGVCLFPGSQNIFTISRVLQLLTGASNMYAAVRAYGSKEFFPHLSDHSLCNM